MSDEEPTNAERAYRLLGDLDALRDLTDEEWNAAFVESQQIADRRATVGRARGDQTEAEIRDLDERAAELRRLLGLGGSDL